ncbi:hypothetical protein Zmor_016643 [Zophobas morio]|uniref:Uncharacterized protein n=1 Tax=Zophobas morio TaxID=2755281 RepID=A0AA38I7R5_9CUCU|nr:hypothetical protein Zmor_016643 [Zophobas morio]
MCAVFSERTIARCHPFNFFYDYFVLISYITVKRPNAALLSAINRKNNRTMFQRDAPFKENFCGFLLALQRTQEIRGHRVVAKVREWGRSRERPCRTPCFR